MGWQDRLRHVGRGLAGATADALMDYAEDGETLSSLVKATATQPEQQQRGQPDGDAEDSQETAPGGMMQDTAEGEPMPDEPTQQDPKTLFWDPFAIVEQLGYKERPSTVTYGTLKSMVWRTPILQAIIQTRIQQMAAFSQVSRDRYDLGFKIRTREATHEPTPAERKWIQQAETMILRTGITDNPRGRDSFEKFLRKFMWDSLTYDQATMEVVPDRKGRPCEFYATDASTFRLADTASTYLNEDQKDAVRYVQIYDGMIISEYNQEELCFGIRNPRTDIRLFGYGVSEVEMLMVVITALLFGWDYNQKAFSQGSTTKGVLNFKGAIPEKQLKSFRRHWYQMVSGVENAWRTPITNADDLQWIAMQNTNRDMEYNAWFDFLIKIACFTPETPLVMGDGTLRPISDVQPGELVATHLGRARKVLNVQKTSHKGKLICIRPQGLSPIRATAEHPFLVASTTDDSTGSNLKWVGASLLRAGRDCLVVPSDHVAAGGKTATTYGFVPIIEIWEEDYDGWVFNLEVEEDHSYQVNRFAVHNCAMFTIDPVEVNFKYGNTGQKSGMNEANNKEKITESKERGLRPLLRFMETCLNQWVIWPINENFEFKFMGMDAKTREEMADLNTKLVKTVRTVDELRAEDDLPPLPDGKGEVILDSTWLQFASAKDQAAQGQQGQPGQQPGADGQPNAQDFQSLLDQYGGASPDDGGGEPTAKSLTPAGKRRRLRLDLRL